LGRPRRGNKTFIGTQHRCLLHRNCDLKYRVPGQGRTTVSYFCCSCRRLRTAAEAAVELFERLLDDVGGDDGGFVADDCCAVVVAAVARLQRCYAVVVVSRVVASL